MSETSFPSTFYNQIFCITDEYFQNLHVNVELSYHVICNFILIYNVGALDKN